MQQILNVFMYKNMRTFGNSSSSVQVSPDLLKCVATDFDRISRRLSYLFYTLACIQVLFSTLSVVMHTNENSGILGDEQTVVLEGVLYSCISELVAGILIIIPVSASLENCRRSYSLAAEYSVSREVVPRKILKQIAATNTLCFSHPFSRSECRALYVEAQREALQTTQNSIRNVASETRQMVKREPESDTINRVAVKAAAKVKAAEMMHWQLT